MNDLDTNIRIKTFKSYSDDDDVFNNWMKEMTGKVIIKDIRELTQKEYIRFIIYYTEIKNKQILNLFIFLNFYYYIRYMKYSEEQLGKIYDVLVELAGARTHVVTKDGKTWCWEKLDFVHSHLEQNTTEYRFCGKLGFGGKYRVNTNTVTYYSEDETVERLAITKATNEELKKILKE